MRNIVFALALVCTGLSAGVFYTWSVSVIPGLKAVPDKTYLETMQAINRAIMNPWFFVVFIGAIPLILSSTYIQFREAINVSFWLLLVASISYLVGTFGVTAFGNVPMNEALNVVRLEYLSVEELKLTRASYEGQWN